MAFCQSDLVSQIATFDRATCDAVQGVLTQCIQGHYVSCANVHYWQLSQPALQVDDISSHLRAWCESV